MKNEIVTDAKALTKMLEAPALGTAQTLVAKAFVAGKNPEEIAKDLDCEVEQVIHTLSNGRVKEYISECIAASGFLNRARRAQLITKVIKQKVQEAGETEILSRKDLLDWLQEADKQDPETRKQKGPGVAVQINNNSNLDKLINDVT